MQYIFFFMPKESNMPAIIGRLTADDSDEAESKITELMPKELREKGYRQGAGVMSSSSADWMIDTLTHEVTILD